MAKVRIKETKNVYMNGINSTIFKGAILDTDSEAYKKYPNLFENIDKEVKKVTTVKPKKVIKEEPKEELLVEAPVAALKVTEEVSVEEAPVEAPKKRKRK